MTARCYTTVRSLGARLRVRLAGADPAELIPQPLIDVLVWRPQALYPSGEPIGWDFGYVSKEGRWHSATEGGSVIDPPSRWWPMPPVDQEESAQCEVRSAGREVRGAEVRP